MALARPIDVRRNVQTFVETSSHSSNPNGEVVVTLETFPLNITPRPLEFQNTRVEFARAISNNHELRYALAYVLHGRDPQPPEIVKEIKDQTGIDIGDNASSSAFLMINDREQVELFQTSTLDENHYDLRSTNIYKKKSLEARCLMSGHVLEIPDLGGLVLFDAFYDMKDFARSLVSNESRVRQSALGQYAIFTTMSRRMTCLSSEGMVIFPQMVMAHLSEEEQTQVFEELADLYLPSKRHIS